MAAKWTDREGWEQNQRAHCWMAAEDKYKRLSDFATEAQITDAMFTLRECWKEAGRQMRAADHDERRNLRWKRKVINGYLKDMRGNEIPLGPYCKDIIGPFDEARRKAVEEEYKRKIRSLDYHAAWADHLKWCAKLYAEKPYLWEGPPPRV